MAFSKHNERVAKIKELASKNKVYTIAIILAILLLFSNFIFSNSSQEAQSNNITQSSSISESITINSTDTMTAESQMTEITVTTTVNKIKRKPPKWRFYWIDLWILIIGGGFCTIKILQEKRKAREKLK